MHFKVTPKHLIVAMATGLFALSAMAQWQWIDKDGRKVFSDRSPPAEIKDKDILKRPGGIRPAATPETTPGSAEVASPSTLAAAPSAATKASAPKLSGKDAELEAKKKLVEKEEAEKKKAADEANAKGRADNCESAKRSLASLQSGVRLSATNANGEREVFDDARRATETKRVQESIEANCK
jgi:hypothetical protein